jgi:hypothetical protein
MSRKAKFAAGLGLGVVGIVLKICFPDHDLAVQIAVWTLFVAAITLAENHRYFREGWFWKAWLLVAALHGVIIASFWHSMPFPTLGVAILMSFPEALVSLLVFRVMAS